MGDLLRIAVQRSGRLSEKTLALISACGIKFGSDSRLLKERAENFPLEFLFVRDDDIPNYVATGVADIGIVGRNVYEEQEVDLTLWRDLGFAKCRLSIAVPQRMEYENLSTLAGKRIATTYPNLLTRALREQGVEAKIVVLSGSVEVAPSINVADAIADIVSTGATLESNGLREVETIYRSTAVMIGRQELSDAKEQILQRLLLRLDAVMKATGYKYVMFNLPQAHLKQVSALVKGMKSPTVTPLLDSSWCAVQTVVHEDEFWDMLEQLKSLGAQGVLVTPIEKMSP